MEEQALYQMASIEGRCPKCGGPTRRINKDTLSGRDMREYECKACGWNRVFDFGVALWKLMSDANRRDAED